jgi:hypothetical protein
MGMTKFASLDSAQVLGIKGSQDRVRTATLDKFSDFDNYRTEDGYLYARIRAISSRVNKNHDGWPSVELAGGQDAFDRFASQRIASFTVEADKGAEYGYSTFLGKPVFVDHHNHDPERARGVVVDAKLHVEDHKTSGLDPYYSTAPDNHLPPTWVELLLEIDAKSFPKLAASIIEGSRDSSKGIDGFSMGCDVEKSVCNICKNAAYSPDDYCEHVRLKGAHFDYIDDNGHKTSKKSYEDCYGIRFFELSAVFDPADETALLRELIHREGSTKESFDPAAIGEAAAGAVATLGMGWGAKQDLKSLQERAVALTKELILQGHPPEEAEKIAFDHVKKNGPEKYLGKAAATPDDIHRQFGEFDDRLNQGLGEEKPNPLPPVGQMPGLEIGRTIEVPGVGVGRIMGAPRNQDGQLVVPIAPETNAMQQIPVPIADILPETEHPLGPHTGKVADYDTWKTTRPEGRTCPRCGEGNLEYDPHYQEEECPDCGYGNGRDWDAEADAQREQERFGASPGVIPVKTAENALPQSDLLHAPEEVDTLRNEQECPVCGSFMDDETCDICGYVEPPDGFNNPDLTKAQEDREGLAQQTDQPDPQDATPPTPGPGADQGLAQPQLLQQGNNPVATAGVKNEMAHAAGRINVIEKPIKPSQDPQTNEPQEQIVQDEPKPVTSSVRTVGDFIEAAGRGKETNMSNERVAAEPVPEASPDKKVDVEGVGGVIEPSNEQASKADSQVDVEAIGGTGVESVSADQEGVNVDQGSETSKNIEEIHTQTWGPSTGDSLGQHDPVSQVAYPSDAGQGAGKWSAYHVSYDSDAYPSEDGGLAGGSTTKGVQPADPVGNAEDRVDVLQAVTSPENNSGPTSTWSGTDGNKVLRQQDPVTNESLEGSDIVDLHPRSSSHIFAAVKLADLEIEVGLTEPEEKYERMAELERQSPEVVQSSLKYVEKIKTKVAQRQAKVARRLPPMSGGVLSKTASNGNSPESPDESLFL